MLVLVQFILFLFLMVLYFCYQGTVLDEPLRKVTELESKEMKLRYYTPEVHRSAFSLPCFAKVRTHALPSTCITSIAFLWSSYRRYWMKNCDILERAQFMIVRFFMKLNMKYNNTIPITHCVTLINT